jgi:hypothetical protein
MQEGEKASLGEIFTFLSGLYFRGKVAYARRFARPSEQPSQVLVITTNRGLLPVDSLITLEELAAFGKVPIDMEDRRYLVPLKKSLESLASNREPDDEFVLLGSISTSKYTGVLIEYLAEQLLFPREFVGRSDMSRGGLLLRSASSGVELEYQPVMGAQLRGKRPSKLQPKSWGYKLFP